MVPRTGLAQAWNDPVDHSNLWYRIIQQFMCCHLFGINFDKELLFDLEVPVEGFETLLDVIDILGYNEKTINLLNKNLPEDYDLSKFPKELIEKMIKYADSFKLVSGDNNGDIEIWRVCNNKYKLLQTLSGHAINITCLCFPHDNKLIASGGNDRIVKIWNVETSELIRYCLYIL